jgi:hypothetical protein
VDAVDASPRWLLRSASKKLVGAASRPSFEGRLPQFRQRPQAPVLSISCCLGVLLPYRCTRRSGQSYAEARLAVRGSPVARTRRSGRPVSVLHRPSASRVRRWGQWRLRPRSGSPTACTRRSGQNETCPGWMPLTTLVSAPEAFSLREQVDVALRGGDPKAVRPGFRA